MDQSPLAVLSDPHGNRFHDAAAIRRPVARLNVQMLAGQAIGTVVAMRAARALRRDGAPADLADKDIFTRVRFIVTFFKRFFLVFPIYGDRPPKSKI